MEFSKLCVKNHCFSITRFLSLPSCPHRSQSPQSSTIRARACNGSNSSTGFKGIVRGHKDAGFSFLLFQPRKPLRLGNSCKDTTGSPASLRSRHIYIWDFFCDRRTRYIQGTDVSTIGTTYSPLLLHAATSILRPVENIHICSLQQDGGLAWACPDLHGPLPGPARTGAGIARRSRVGMARITVFGRATSSASGKTKNGILAIPTILLDEVTVK